MSTGLTLELSSREGNKVILAPSWDDIERAIRSLDGKTHCEVFIGDRATTEGFNVTGGPRRYLVWVQRWDSAADELAIDTAYDRSSPPGTVRFALSNGQVDVFPVGQTVDLQAVMRAARTYLEHDELDPNVDWNRQGQPAGPKPDLNQSSAAS